MELAELQARLLEILATEDDPNAAFVRLLNEPAATPYREWLADADPRMVQVAAEVLRRWKVEG